MIYVANRIKGCNLNPWQKMIRYATLLRVDGNRYKSKGDEDDEKYRI